MTPANPDYPVDLEIEYPGHLSRLLIFVKWLLAVPHYIVLFILGIAAWFVWLFSFFAIIVTGRYPAGAYQFMVGVLRWANRVSAYVFLMTDSN